MQATVTITAGTSALSVEVQNPNPGSASSNTANASIYLASATAAARLLDQATFGPTLADIQHVQNIGIDAYITSQFNIPDTPLPNIPSPLPAACLAANTSTVCEESEWWQTALTGNDQLRQRVAFALSELFVISSDSDNATTITYYHNTLAQDAFTNFSTIMNDVTLSPGRNPAPCRPTDVTRPPTARPAGASEDAPVWKKFALGWLPLVRPRMLIFHSPAVVVLTRTSVLTRPPSSAWTTAWRSAARKLS